MSYEPDDPIDLLARELPALDVEPARAELIRSLAHAELERQRPGWRRTAKRVYRRAELAAVGVAALGYFVWTFQSVLLAYR